MTPWRGVNRSWREEREITNADRDNPSVQANTMGVVTIADKECHQKRTLTPTEHSEATSFRVVRRVKRKQTEMVWGVPR